MNLEPPCRYKNSHFIMSTDTLFHDLTLNLKFLLSQDFIKNCMFKAHTIPFTNNREINNRSKKIISHAQAAIEYIDQAYNGPQEIAFLPLYYSILNLAKIYILMTPLFSKLDDNRWHGASYNVNKKIAKILTQKKLRSRKMVSYLYFMSQ